MVRRYLSETRFGIKHFFCGPYIEDGTHCLNTEMRGGMDHKDKSLKRAPLASIDKAFRGG